MSILYCEGKGENKLHTRSLWGVNPGFQAGKQNGFKHSSNVRFKKDGRCFHESRKSQSHKSSWGVHNSTPLPTHDCKNKQLVNSIGYIRWCLRLFDKDVKQKHEELMEMWPLLRYADTSSFFALKIISNMPYQPPLSCANQSNALFCTNNLVCLMRQKNQTWPLCWQEIFLLRFSKTKRVQLKTWGIILKRKFIMILTTGLQETRIIKDMVVGYKQHCLQTQKWYFKCGSNPPFKLENLAQTNLASPPPPPTSPHEPSRHCDFMYSSRGWDQKKVS